MRDRPLSGHFARAGSVAIFAVIVTAACTRDADDRRAVLETAQRESYDISRDTVVQLMRSPPDSGRLVYDDPLDLGERAAGRRGEQQVWAPFGIAQPDTVPASAQRSPPRPDTAGVSR